MISDGLWIFVWEIFCGGLVSVWMELEWIWLGIFIWLECLFRMCVICLLDGYILYILDSGYIYGYIGDIKLGLKSIVYSLVDFRLVD